MTQGLTLLPRQQIPQSRDILMQSASCNSEVDKRDDSVELTVNIYYVIVIS